MSKYLFFILFSMLIIACQGQNPSDGDNNVDDKGINPEPEATAGKFVMGANLCCANQILVHGGTFRDSDMVKNPCKIFSNYGTDVVRLRLWHNPEWIAVLYEGENNMAYTIT